ncbi:hypothetical protein JXB41_07120 [Candidatus Woesearchaeota archaeon]|nr:hypothetical protein [Candidatus Woesearchaeota archaeon]
MHLSEYLKYLKNEMKNVKKTIKESRKMKEITKINEKKIEIKKLNKFRDDLTDKEREYWVKALTAIERNPKYLKGQYNTYRNSIDPLITYNRYTNLYIMAKKIREQEEIKVNNSLI